MHKALDDKLSKEALELLDETFYFRNIMMEEKWKT
jgi:hypothetical protein